LLTGLPVGSVLGELLAGSLLTPARRARLVVPLATAGFAPVLLFAVTPSLPVTMALLVLAGLTTSYFIGLDQLALATVPEDLRRRGFALQSAGMMVTQGLGFATAGALAEWLPVNAVIPIVAACGIVVALVVGLGLRRAHPAARRRETATA
jgi:predicted MFS family arabinose efflux permease